MTQWNFVDLGRLGDLLGCADFSNTLAKQISTMGFGQMRWYGADRETSRHSDGFDGICAGTGFEVVGRSRILLRLGGDGFLTFHFERAGGRSGRLDLLVKHGDLILMDRDVAGTLRSGWQRQKSMRVTHRAGGLLARHCPEHLKDSNAKSFVTLVWTSDQSREEFLALLLSRWAKEIQSSAVEGANCASNTNCWPVDPTQVELKWRALLPWSPGLSLLDRQLMSAPKLQKKHRVRRIRRALCIFCGKWTDVCFAKHFSLSQVERNSGISRMGRPLTKGLKDRDPT